MTADTGQSPSDASRVRHGEWPALLLSMVYFFCVLCAYYVLRPVREQFTAIAGSQGLLWLYVATFAGTLLLTPLFAALVSRYPRRVMVPVVYSLFALCLVGLVPVFGHRTMLDSFALGVGFYVWLSIFNLFVVSVFWIFMSDVWAPAQASRLFPLIGFAGTAGAIAGPAITKTLVERIGIAPLLGVSAALLVVGIACAIRLGRWARLRESPTYDAPLGGTMLDGLRQVITQPAMRNMALLLLLADGIGTVNYGLLADYAKATFGLDAEAKTAFHATADLASNAITIVMQLGVTWWLLPAVGAGRVLVLWALIGVASLGAVLVVPDAYAPVVAGLPTVALAAVISRGIAYGLAEPARHWLFTRMPRNERYKGQNAVDTAVWRFGDLVVALLMRAGGALGMGVAGFASLGMLAAGGATVVGWRLSRRVAEAATGATLRRGE